MRTSGTIRSKKTSALANWTGSPRKHCARSGKGQPVHFPSEMDGLTLSVTSLPPRARAGLWDTKAGAADAYRIQTALQAPGDLFVRELAEHSFLPGIPIVA